MSSLHTVTEPSQLDLFSIVLDGHRDSVNTIKFDPDVSMLLSGGKLFVCLLSVV